MPIKNRPILINDGGSKKTSSSSSSKKQIEAGRKRRQFNNTSTAASKSSSTKKSSTSSSKKEEPERVTLPTWQQIKAGRARREFNNTVPGVTASKLNASKELADTRSNTWQKLTSIHEEKQSQLEASREKLENYRNQSGFKYLANDYEVKINRANQAFSNYQANPSTFNANQVSAAMQDLQRWENDHKRDLDKYSQLTDDYNTAAREYNRSAESLNRYAPAAQRAEENYTTLFGNFDWSNQAGLSSSVKKDYQNVLTAQSQAIQQMKKDLETQRDQLQSQIEAMSRTAKNSIDRGTGNANLQLQQLRQLNEQLQTVESNLVSLQEQEEAQKLEELAKSDPKFKNEARKGEKLVDEYLQIIMNSGNLDSYEEYNAMTEEQKEIYSYYMYSDPEKANAYKQGISKEINQTLANRRQNLMEQSIEENPTLAGLSTIITRPFTTGRIAAEALASLGQDGSRTADPNTRGQAQLRAEETARQASLEQTNNPVLQTLGQAGYAIADMAPALVANAYLPGAGTAYMGLMGGTSGYADAASRGLTNQQALAFIGAAFAGGKKPATPLLRQVLGSFLAEGSEEAAEQVAQTIYDELISGTKSARNQAVQQYMKQGMSRQQAEKKAWEDIGSETLQSFIVGGIAGGAMSGAAGVVNNVTDSRLSQDLQQFGLTKEEADSLVKAQRPAREYSISEVNSDQKAEHVKSAIDYFGKTYSWNETGYVTPNGTKLDFSGKHEGGPGGYRTVDHRDIADALGEEYGDGSYSGAMTQFMSEGNIRISPESSGINLSVAPTKSQESALSDFISRNRGEVILDIDTPDGQTVASVEYPRGTHSSKILNDIRAYFSDGALPQVTSEVGKYRYSVNDNGSQNINEESIASIEKLSSDMGVTTVFDDSLPQNVNGYYDTQTGEIHINPNADSVNTVFSHELTHSLENTQAYQKLKDLVLNELGDEAETLRQQKTELYNKLGKELDVDSELVADYISQNLFTDADSIRRVAETDRSLATRIKNWITRMIAKVTGNSEKAFLKRAEGLYSQALQEASQGREAISFNSTQQTEVNAQESTTGAETAGKNYSVSPDRQVQRLQQQNQELRRQMTRTTETKPNPTRVRSTARQILENYGSRYDRNALTQDLDSLYTFMGSGSKAEGNTTVEMSFEEAKSQAMDIAGKVLNQAEATNSYTQEEYNSLRQTLQENPVAIPQDVRQDISGGYADFRRRHRTELRISQDGVSIEDLWSTLEAQYPGMFDSQVYSNPSDMLEHIGDVLDNLRTGTYNPFASGEADLSQEQEVLANDILERFFSIPQRSPTFADKQAIKITKEKIRSRKQLDAERARSQARVKKLQEESRAKRIELKKASAEKVKQVRAEEREKGKKQVQKLKAHHKEMDDAARDRRYRADTREKIQRHVSDLSHKLLHPSDKSHIPDELTQPVANLLDAINLESTFSTTIGKDGKLHRAAPDEGAPTKRTQAFRELREAYVKIANNPRYKNTMVIDPDLQANMDAVIAMKDIRLQDMTQEQLNTVWATVAAVEHSISTVNQLFAESRYKTLEAQANAVYEGLRTQKTKVERRGAIGMVDRLLNIENVTPFDYFHEWGEGGDAMFAAARSAQDTQIRDYVDIQNFLADTVTGKEITKWRDTKSETFTINGQKINLTIPQKMSLYVLDKREQGRKHIYGGGIEQGAVTVKGNKIEKSTEPVRATPEDVKRITSTLTDRQKRVADALGMYMSTYLAERGNMVSMALYGYQKFTEENYFPINVDPNYTARQLGETQVQGSIEGKGFTKALEQNASNPLVLYDIFSVFAKHSAEMTAYHAWLPFLKDAERVYNFRMGDGFTGSISEQISRVLGSNGAKYFETFIADLNGQANLRNDFDASALLSNYKRAAVGANLRVIIQQPTAYSRALAVIDAKYLALGLFTPKDWETLKKWAPIAQWKDWGYFEVNTGRQLEDVILDTDTRFEKFQQGLMAAAGKADEITWTRLWSAAQWYVKDKFQEIPVGSDQFYMKAAEKFGEIVDRTQVVDSVLHRTQIMRSPSTLNKMASAFMGEPSKTYNLLRTSLRDVKVAKPGAKGAAVKKLYRASIGFLISGTVNAAAASIVDALRDDDEDETYLEKWWQAFTGLQGDEENWTEALQSLLSGNIADNLNILNMIPYVKDFLSLYQGYSVDRMDMAAADDFMNAAGKFIKALQGEGKTSLYKALTDLALQGARFLGIPATNILRDGGAITQTVIRGIDNPLITYNYNQLSAPVEKNKGMYYDLLWDALLKGDVDGYKIVRDDMINNHGLTFADIRSAMKERFKEEWQANPDIATNLSLMEQVGVTAETITGWKQDAFKKQWESDPSIAEDTAAMEAAGVTEDNIKAWQESKWKESGYVEDMKALGEDLDTVEAVVRQIKSMTKSEDQRTAIRNSNLSQAAKAVLYRTIAGETDAEVMDYFSEQGWNMVEAYRALDGMASNSKSLDKIQTLLASGLTDMEIDYMLEQKVLSEDRYAEMHNLVNTGMTVRDYMAAYEAYLTLDADETEGMTASDRATKFSQWLDQQQFTQAQKDAIKDEFSFYSIIRAGETKYDRFTEAGLSPDTATFVEEMLSGLKPIGDSDSVGSTQQALAISGASISNSDKLKALSVVLNDSTYSKVEEAYQNGIAPGIYVPYWNAMNKIRGDKDENGESIKKGYGSAKSKKVTYIDNLDLPVELKNYLYLQEYKESTIDEAPWYGGERYEGSLFDDEETAAISQPTESYNDPNQSYSPIEGFSSDRVTQRFGSGHTGTDIGHTSGNETEPIYATENGTVTWVQTGYGNLMGQAGVEGTNASYGNLVQVTFEDGSYAIMAHLSDVAVQEGDQVVAGQQIGNMGNSGWSSGAHLHFELHAADGSLLDSTAYLEGESMNSPIGGTRGSGYTSGGSGSSGSKGSSSSGKSSSSSKKSSGSKSSSKQKKLSTISLSTGRDSMRSVPQAPKMTTSRVKSISLPTVKSITKSALNGGTSGVSVPTVGGIDSRVSREGADVRFIKL